MLYLRKLFTTVGWVLLSYIAHAGEPGLPTELTARQLKLKSGEATLSEVLAELEKQTGNRVADRRTARRDDPKLKLRPGTFWQTLDAIGEQTGIAFTPHGGVALVDTPYRKATTVYHGPFRFAIKNIAVNRDDELQTHNAHVTISVAWEPRFAPMYLNLKNAEVTVGKHTEKLVAGGIEAVFGAGATKIELSAPAPPRAAMRIDSIKGEIRVVGAPKMLEFTFDKLGPLTQKNPREAEQEGVTIRLSEVKQFANRWQVTLQIVNPPGAISGLESFQLPYWTNNNRLWLTWTDPQTKRTSTLEPSGDSYQDTKDGRIINFTFTPQGDTPLPPKTAAVTLRYRTPNRVLAFTVPFEFQNLALP